MRSVPFFIFSFLAFSMLSFSAKAATVVVPNMGESYSWDKVDCFAESFKDKSNPNLVIQTRREKEGKGPYLKIIVANFKNIWENAAGEKVKLTVTDANSGSVHFLDKRGRLWGTLNRRDLKSVCQFTLEKSPLDPNEVTIDGKCDALGDAVKKQGPRFHLLVDAVDNFQCKIRL